MSIAEKIADTIIANHNVRVEGSLCTRFRSPKSGCTSCADICPVDAISLSGKGAELTGACNECGVCLSVCPNGVFSMKKRGDEELIGEIDETAERRGRGQTKEFCISCERGDGKADLLAPCLGRLTEALLIKPISAGFSSIHIARPECPECPNAKASPHIDRMLDRARALFEMVNVKSEKLVVRRMPLQPPAQRPEKPVTRRELFSALRSKAAEMAAAALPEGGEKTEGKEMTFLQAIGRNSGNVKRTLLVQALKAFSQVKEAYLPSEQAMLADITVSPRCTACGVCASLCPTKALTNDWTGDKFSVTFKPSLCTNCRVCVDTCGPRAITIGESARLNCLIEDKTVKVFEAGRKICPVCRMDFILPSGDLSTAGGEAPGLPDICPLCLDRHKKQQAFLQQGFLK